MALYSKYRPDSFDLVIGQDAAVEVLKASLQAGKLSHACLLSGPHGIGKTTLARLIAQCLTCSEAPTSSPCGVCPGCLAFSEGNHPDLLEMDAASNRGVDDAKAIRNRLTVSPMLSDKTVLIIDEAQMLTREAQNALLKTLEEPPEGVYFIFATTAPDKLLPTIRSRCQHYMLRKPSSADLSSSLERVILAENFQCGPEAVQAICSAADGSYRDALSLLEQAASGSDGQITLQAVHDSSGMAGTEVWHKMCQAVAEGQEQIAMAIVEDLAASGMDLRSTLSELERFLRLILYSQAGAMPESLGVSDQEREAASQVAELISSQALWILVDGIESAYQVAAFGGSAALALESSLAQAAITRDRRVVREADQSAEPEPKPKLAAEPEPAVETTEPDPDPKLAADPEPEQLKSEQNSAELPAIEIDTELPGPAVAAAAFPLLKLALRTHYPEQYLVLRTAWGRYDDKRLIVQIETPLSKEASDQALSVLRRMVEGSVRLAARKSKSVQSPAGRKGESKVKPSDDREALLASMGLTPLEGERRSEQEKASQGQFGASPGEN